MKVLFLLIIFNIFIPCLSQAEETVRETTLEWDAMTEATGYDIEIRNTKSRSVQIYKAKVATWAGKLNPGKYQLRVRSKDQRGVPGPWSAPEEFMVHLSHPQNLTPKTNAVLKSDQKAEDKLELKWDKVNGAASYIVQITSEDKRFNWKNRVTENGISLKVPVAMKYTWSVLAESKDQIQSEKPIESKVFFLGAKIEKPEIIEPKNEFLRKLDWNKPTFSQSFDYIISFYNEEARKWEVVERKNSIPQNQIPFSQKFPGGQYKLAVRSNAKYRQSSDASELVFDAANGSRSPAAEQVAEVRQSIERNRGWFGVASYLLTMIEYAGSNYDLGAEIPTGFDSPVIGGTGRLGIGYLSNKSQWGFLGVVDASGFTLNGSTYPYAGVEFNSIHRIKLGDHGELRQQIGIIFREFPFLIPTGVADSFNFQKASTIGPRYGIEYWHALTEKIGFQVNAHINTNFLTFTSPNASSMELEGSYQFGLLGSYRLGQKTTGLMGYAYKTDNFSYRSNNQNRLNSSSINGHYLNFFLEWNL